MGQWPGPKRSGCCCRIFRRRFYTHFCVLVAVESLLHECARPTERPCPPPPPSIQPNKHQSIVVVVAHKYSTKAPLWENQRISSHLGSAPLPWIFQCSSPTLYWDRWVFFIYILIFPVRVLELDPPLLVPRDWISPSQMSSPAVQFSSVINEMVFRWLLFLLILFLLHHLLLLLSLLFIFSCQLVVEPVPNF